MRLKAALVLALAIGLFQAAPAQASLTGFQSFVGTYGVSTDGFGSTTGTGTISASVPVGATVVAAYLYSSTFGGTTSATGTLAGQAVNYSTALGFNSGLQAFRADVTSIVAPLANGGSASPINFAVTETSSNVDGEALVVVYSLASLPVATVGILDGFSASGGDATALNFAQPLNTAQAGFFAEMRLGIGFSFDSTGCTGGSQTSTIRVGPTPVPASQTQITANAGCNDDSADAGAANSNLITVGGYDDPFSVQNPTIPNDHERYDLVPYISNGDLSINLTTNNPSNDDNIFLAVFHVFGRAGINAPPPDDDPNPSPVPEPGTLSLLALGGAAVFAKMRRRKQA
jgi:hypothetical protein